jgi:hypothetical protein
MEWVVVAEYYEKGGCTVVGETKYYGMDGCGCI